MIYKEISRNLFSTASCNGYRLTCLRFMTSKSKEPHILFEENDRTAVLILNRPKVLNAFSMESVHSLNEHLREYQRTKSLVIFKGASSDGKCFSVGGDMAAALKGGIEFARECFKEMYTLLYFISNYKIPQIALIDGMIMGAGVAYAVLGRYSVATERTVLSMPETGVGLFPDVGSSYFLNRLNGKIGLYLGMTGRRLIGKDVADMGPATHFCQSSRLPNLETSLSKCRDSSEVLNILNSFSSNRNMDSNSNLLIEKINTCFAGESVEEIYKNLENDGSEWARGILKTLAEKSPLSLKIAYQQLKKGEQLPLSECLKMEYRLAWRCLASSNFNEGIRARLIEKDNKPKWIPSTLEAVTETQVAELFNKLPDEEELKLPSEV